MSRVPTPPGGRAGRAGTSFPRRRTGWGWGWTPDGLALRWPRHRPWGQGHQVPGLPLRADLPHIIGGGSWEEPLRATGTDPMSHNDRYVSRSQPRASPGHHS